MNYKAALICLALIGVLQAQEVLNGEEIPNIYLLDKDVDLGAPQTLSFDINDAPSNADINFKWHPKFKMQSELKNQHYKVIQSNEAVTSLSETLIEFTAKQKQSFLDLGAQLSKQLQDTLIAQEQELKQTIEESERAHVSMGHSDFDQHLNWLGRNVYADCQQALDSNRQQSGVYILDLKSEGLKPFGVYCKYDDGKAWTIIQRRQNGKVDFYRNWSDYKQGFGDVNEEYWLGLDRIHALTSKEKHELWLQMETYNGEERSLRYGEFSIDNEEVLYRLNLAEFKGENKNDAQLLDYNNELAFSTYDSDNNYGSINCAIDRKGAWWYDNCTSCNPNGIYRQGDDKTGIHCGYWHEPMKEIFLAISQAK